MIAAQMTRNVVLFTAGATIATNADTTVSVDTANVLGGGVAVAEFLIAYPKSTATNSTAAWTTCKLTENTSASTTGATNIAVGGTDFTIPANTDTTEGVKVKMAVNMLGARKRYLILTLQAPDTNNNRPYAHVEFSRLGQSPNTTTERGVSVYNVSA